MLIDFCRSVEQDISTAFVSQDIRSTNARANTLLRPLEYTSLSKGSFTAISPAPGFLKRMRLVMIYLEAAFVIQESQTATVDM